jgi:hypothetical protein
VGSKVVGLRGKERRGGVIVRVREILLAAKKSGCTVNVFKIRIASTNGLPMRSLRTSPVAWA